MEISISTVFSGNSIKWLTYLGNNIKWSTYLGNSIKNGHPISEQDKPVISVGFKAQTIHTQPTIQQIVKQASV